MKTLILFLLLWTTAWANPSFFNALSEQMYEVNLQLQEEMDNSITVKPIIDHDLYKENQTVIMRLCSKPQEDYYWETLIEIPNFTEDNFYQKLEEIKRLSRKEVKIRSEKAERSKQLLSDQIEGMEEGIGVEARSDGLTAWIKIPNSNEWMRTKVMAATKNGHMNARVRSTVWTLDYKNTYYSQTDVGILELGVIEALVSTNETVGTQIKLINVSTARSYDINQHLSFFYQYGGSMGFEFIKVMEEVNASISFDGEARVGLIYDDTFSLSLGTNATVNIRGDHQISPDLKFNFTHNNLSFQVRSGFTQNTTFNQDLHQLTPQWNSGISLTVRMK